MDGLYEIRCVASGDTAEAEDLAAALYAAATLVRDHGDHRRAQGASRAARLSLIISRDGVYDGPATSRARGYRS